MRRNLVAVIVTFNRIDKLKVALGHTRKNAFYKIVIVNNCSTDGTKEWLDTLTDDNLVIIHSRTNQGGAGGFYLGFRYAAEQLPEADWLVCFDDDAHPEGNIVDSFDKLDIPADVGSLAAAVYLPDGRISEMNRPSRNPFWHLGAFLAASFKGRHGFHIDDERFQFDTPMEIDASSFVGCFIRLSLIRKGKIGLPRRELFIYADDIIYVLQIRKAGFRHWFVPTIAFSHDCQTLVNQMGIYHPIWKAYYTYRNGLEMYRVASGVFYPIILIVKIPSFFLAVRHYEANERKRFLVIAAKAVWDGIRRDYTMSHDQVEKLGRSSS
jgi:rhamnopyranosyl-N-acetylglucosaminyl-diphospho-decaprenol beta-1,3/1,4-galactofuranosyltransferase